MTTIRFDVFVALASATLATIAASGLPAAAQKGVGDAAGVARQAEKPAAESFAGTVADIKIGPCERTTGRFIEGVHVRVRTEDRSIDLHIGPAAALRDLLDQIAVNDQISFEAFRTEALPKDAYVAKSLKRQGTTYEFRDDALRPAWAIAGQGGGQGGGQGTGQETGRKGRGVVRDLDVGPDWKGSKGACYW